MQADRLVDLRSGRTRSAAELLRQAGEEAVERGVRDRAAQLRVDLGVDRPRVDDAVDEPGRRAVGEPLELGDVERRARAELLEHDRVAQPRRPVEGAQRAVEPALPAVRARERRRASAALGRRERGERAQPLALGRRVLERPRERRERAPARRARDLVARRRARATSSQNGLGSRGLPSSVAASRTR